MIEFLCIAVGFSAGVAVCGYFAVRYLDEKMGRPRWSMRDAWRALVAKMRGKRE